MTTTRLTSIRGTEYLGSHPGAPTSLPDVDVVFSTAGVRFERRGEELGALDWSEVTALSVDGTHTTRRPTFPRFVVFGLLGALFQRRTDTALLRVETTGGPWVFGVDDLSATELRAGLEPLGRYYRK